MTTQRQDEIEAALDRVTTLVDGLVIERNEALTQRDLAAQRQRAAEEEARRQEATEQETFRQLEECRRQLEMARQQRDGYQEANTILLRETGEHRAAAVGFMQQRTMAEQDRDEALRKYGLATSSADQLQRDLRDTASLLKASNESNDHLEGKLQEAEHNLDAATQEIARLKERLRAYKIGLEALSAAYLTDLEPTDRPRDNQTGWAEDGPIPVDEQPY